MKSRRSGEIYAHASQDSPHETCNLHAIWYFRVRACCQTGIEFEQWVFVWYSAYQNCMVVLSFEFLVLGYQGSRGNRARVERKKGKRRGAFEY